MVTFGVVVAEIIHTPVAGTQCAKALLKASATTVGRNFAVLPTCSTGLTLKPAMYIVLVSLIDMC